MTAYVKAASIGVAAAVWLSVALFVWGASTLVTITIGVPAPLAILCLPVALAGAYIFGHWSAT